MEVDLCGYVCPLSKIKAVQAIDSLAEGQTCLLILGDTESLKSVVQELKARGIRPEYERTAESRYVLTISK